MAHHDNKVLNDATLNSVTAAKLLGGEINLLVVGENCAPVVEAASKIDGIKRVFVAEGKELGNHLAENVATVLLDLQKAQSFSHILAPATSIGKSILPRVAGKLDVQPISDVIGIKSNNTFVRPVYAGNALSTVESSDKVKVMTVRPTAFVPAGLQSTQAVIEKFAPSTPFPNTSSWLQAELSKSERPELGSARIVVSGGRALGSAENFKILEKLADRLGAAMGASRAAVDAGYVPNDWQVGQTGKVVAPDLYFAVGISGAIQHLAGMKDSKTIVAINKDPEAPIFQVADYGIVGDLFKVVPELEQQIAKAKTAKA